MEKVTVESAKNLTLEDMKQIAEFSYRSGEVIDYTKYKQAEKALDKEGDNIEKIAFAIKQRAIELGVGPDSDYDSAYDDEGEELPEGSLKYELHEFLQDVAGDVGKKYGEGEWGEGSEDYFWIPSTC